MVLLAGSDILATKEVTFSTDILNRPISAVVEPERNGRKISFVKGNPVLIDVVTEAIVISKFSNYGTLVNTSNDIKTITETIAFINSSQATLSSIPSAKFSYQWLGSKIGGSTKISRTDNTLTMSQVGTGLIKVQYDVNVKIYTLTEGKDSVLCVFVNEDGNSASVMITFAGSDCETTAGSVTITVIDYTTGLPLSGASVAIDGIGKGTTGTDGKLNVGNLSTGSHSIDIQKSGYASTGSDCIDNSDFVL